MSAPRPLVLPAVAREVRLDRAIHELLASAGHRVSVREVRRALRAGELRVDGRRRDPGDRARGGEHVELAGFVPREEAELAPEPELLARAPVLFEDQHLLALAKPSGVPSAPLRSTERGTLLGAAIAHAPEIGAAGPPLEGGLAHRLDVGTSGVVLFAKDEVTRAELRAAFSSGAIEKVYLALVRDPAGVLGASARISSGAIAPGNKKDRVRVVEAGGAGGLPARTEARALERFAAGLAWVEAFARTGRRHQIRAHLAHEGAPIVGDPIYGDLEQDRAAGRSAGVELPDRLALHASRVRLPSGRIIVAPEPEALRRVLSALAGPGPVP